MRTRHSSLRISFSSVFIFFLLRDATRRNAPPLIFLVRMCHDPIQTVCKGISVSNGAFIYLLYMMIFTLSHDFSRYDLACSTTCKDIHVKKGIHCLSLCDTKEGTLPNRARRTISAVMCACVLYTLKIYGFSTAALFLHYRRRSPGTFSVISTKSNIKLD